MKQVVFDIDGTKYKVKAFMSGAELWLHINGETWVLDTAQKATRAGGSAKSKAEQSGELFAPMPGKILKVNFKNGQTVDEKQVVIIMEAMKMEYSLVAPFQGVLKQLNCKAGDQVELNQLLGIIEKKEN
jgi:acetyl/propionyl-CoA carboxylase alpha subunit